MIPAQADALLDALSKSGPGANIQEDDGPSNCVTKALEAAAPEMHPRHAQNSRGNQQ